MKRFNVTGVCVKEKHYMVDISDKLREIMKMVLRGDYFTINRGRQYGKTTTLFAIRDELVKQGIVSLPISFEGADDEMFESSAGFCKGLLWRIDRAHRHLPEYDGSWHIAFLEEHGELLLLSFLKPLVNGNGFFYVESRLMDMRRIDIIAVYKSEQFIIELKLWRGEAYRDKAISQLLGYMDVKNLDKGYLITFDLRKDENKEFKAEWVDIDDKKIFEVIM